MKNYFILPFLCFCMFLTACAATQNELPPAPPPAAQLRILPVAENPSIYVEVINKTKAKENLKGTIFALMQSEHGAQEAYEPEQADYIISVTMERFGMLGTVKEGADAVELAIPTISGLALGTQIGGAISADGAFIGAGVGLLAGLALGSAMGSDEVMVWQMDARVSVKDKNNKEYVTDLTPREKGKDMVADTAAAALENAVAWAVVRSFEKKK